MLSLSSNNPNVHIKEHQCTPSHFKLLFDENKYLIEEHQATTKDGYILNVYRVRLQQALIEELPEANKKNVNKPVLLQHGLVGSSDDHFMNGDKSYGYHFVNLGYDVWVGNNRGNKYNKQHVRLDISKQEFYDFSFQEMGLYDVPTFYDLILSHYQDQSTKIIYAGQSQGTSQFFVAGADETTKTYIRSKTSRFFALNPIAYMTHIKSGQLKTFSHHAELLFGIAEFLGINNIVNWGCINPNTLTIKALVWACNTFKSACNELARLEVGDPTVLDFTDVFGTIITHVPSGGTAKCFDHFAQLIDGDKNGNPTFRKFDYGSELANMKHYNQITPPDWTFSDWDIPTTMLTGSIST